MKSKEELALADSYGIAARPDDQRGKGCWRFQIGETHIWLCANGWQVADLIDGSYCNHNLAGLRDNDQDFDKALEAAFVDAVNRQDQDVLVNLVADEVGRLADRIRDLYDEDTDFFGTKMDDAQEIVTRIASEMLACDDGLVADASNLVKKLGLEPGIHTTALGGHLWNVLVSEVVKRFGLWLVNLEGYKSASGSARAIIDEHFQQLQP